MKRAEERGRGNTEGCSSRAVGGSVAPGCRGVVSSEGRLNGDRAESRTLPVDSNNNGRACSTETMCSAGWISYSLCCFLLTLTDARRSVFTGAGNKVLLNISIQDEA